GAILRTLEIAEVLPTRLSAAKRLPVESDVEPFGGEETLPVRNEVVKAHALRSDRHLCQAGGHGVVLPEPVGGTRAGGAGRLARSSTMITCQASTATMPRPLPHDGEPA